MTTHWIAGFVLVAASAAALAAEGMNVWVAPDTCKVNPRSGNVLEEHTFLEDPSIPPPGYLRRRMGDLKGLPYYTRDSYAGPPGGKLRTKNPVWDAATKTVALRAARNEFAAFQVVIEKSGDAPLKGVTVARPALKGPAAFDTAANVVRFRELYMPMARRYEDSWNMTGPVGKRFWYPDALVYFDIPGQRTFDVPDAKVAIPGQTNQAVWVDVYVPHGQKPGLYAGPMKVTAAGGQAVEITVRLEVLPLTLPDRLNFTIDMMASARPIAQHWKLGLKNAAHYKKYLSLERQYYRLFHAHRCTLNMFPGAPSTRKRSIEQVVLPGFTPAIAGAGKDIRVADWSGYDEHFGDYYSGEAFADLPRKAVPVRHAFLPQSLGWPSPLAKYFDDRETYAVEFKKVLADFADHFAARGWTKTEFQFFLNGKKKFGEPWNTDEPTSDADYAALEYWGELTRDALGPRGKRKVDIVYRVDIGTPQRMPGKIDDVCDLRNINYEAYPQYGFFWGDFRRRQQAAGERWWVYAADRGNQRWARIDWPQASSIIWAWAMWDLDVPVNCKWASLLVHPTDPLGRPGCQWNYCGYVYPGKPIGYDGPLPSIRLKATRRGLEDMEYLKLLADKDGNRRRADAILLKYYTTWDRAAKKPRPPGSVRVGPEDPYRLRAEIITALR